jgi:outer membrane protein TolC
MFFKKIGILIFAIVGIALFLNSCSSRYVIDMEKHRQDAVKEDMPLISKRDAVKFNKPLTLNDVINVGLKNNLDLRVRKIMEEVQDGKTIANKLQMLPKLDATGTYSHRNKYDITNSKNIETGEITEGTTYSDEKNKTLADLTLSWNALDFGLSYIRSRQHAMSGEIKRIETRRQAQILTMRLIAAYWKTVIAEANLNKIKEAEATISQYKGSMEKLLKSKRVEPINVKKIEKKQISLAQNAARLQGEVSNAKIELVNLMGLNPSVNFDIVHDDIFNYADIIPEFEKFDTAKLELLAITNRPELFISDMELLIQRDEAKSILISMFPSLRFDAGYNYDSNEFLQDNEWTSAGANVAINILGIPSKIALYKSQGKNLELQKSKRTLTTVGIITQLHMSLRKFQIVKKDIDFQIRLYNIQKDIVEMARIRHKEGYLPDMDMANYVLEETVARLERDRALTEYIGAYSMLMTTLGLDYNEWNKIK